MSIYCPDCHEDLAAGHEEDCPQVASPGMITPGTMTKIEEGFWFAFTLIGGLAGIGLFFTAIAVFSRFIICIAGKAC